MLSDAYWLEVKGPHMCQEACINTESKNSLVFRHLTTIRTTKKTTHSHDTNLYGEYEVLEGPTRASSVQHHYININLLNM